jgi:hypothetical protein
MRCECFGEPMGYRIATEDGELKCCSGNRCPYKAGDYIMSLQNPLKPGETCETALTPGIFSSSCKVIA